VSDPTPSEPHEARASQGRTPLERALDVLVFVPAEVVLGTLCDAPHLAERGRERLKAPVRTARVLGEMTVSYVKNDLEGRADWLFDTLFSNSEGAVTSAAAPAHSADPESPQTFDEHDDDAASSSEETASAPLTAPEPAEPEEPVDLAIPGYDALSASQVVRRLDGLGTGELEAVYAHEAATRGRRTILHRARQLLGFEDPPGTALADETPDASDDLD
jgi:hypothetical protein